MSRLLVSLKRASDDHMRLQICALSIQLAPSRRGTRAQHPAPVCHSLGDDPKQFLDTIASDRRTIPNSARWTRIALIIAVCSRIYRWHMRSSIRPLCCSGVFVSTKRMFALVTASQMASASARRSSVA